MKPVDVALNRSVTRRGTDEADDAVDLLLACHARIRQHTALAARLAAAPVATAPERASVADAAARVHRYFTVALPLHTADEELSLLPRLRAATPSPEVLAALAAMTAQHDALDACLAALAPRWDALRRARPEQDPRGFAPFDALDALAEGAARLDALWTDHLGMEERVIFPAARTLLRGDALGQVRAEIAERRRADPSPAGPRGP